MFRFLPLVFKNSLRNPLRSILTISSIAVSLCLLSVLLSMYHALFYGQATPGQALRLVVRNRASLAQTMPAACEQKILKVPGVVAESVWTRFGGTYKDNRDQRNFFAAIWHRTYSIPGDTNTNGDARGPEERLSKGEDGVSEQQFALSFVSFLGNVNYSCSAFARP